MSESRAGLGRPPGMGKIDFLGTLRDGPNFEMDVQMGGFPIVLEMQEYV